VGSGVVAVWDVLEALGRGGFSEIKGREFSTCYSQPDKFRRTLRLSITQYNVCHMEWRTGAVRFSATMPALVVRRQVRGARGPLRDCFETSSND
jgi:hypothetical protein